jgi:serine/threonine protein kinase/Tol biopolymer transport system component
VEKTRWQTIEEIFNGALGLPRSEREAFLTSASGDDADLRAEVDELLSEADRPNKFLSESDFALSAHLLIEDLTESVIGEKFGAYTLIRSIGRGGMGEVYLAQDERLGRKVAIKLLPRPLIEDEQRILRFKHEARAASAISHPNVAHIYEIGESNGRFFTAMEFVDGATLRELFAKGILPFDQAIDIAIQVCSAIAAAHACGIIHRDIKPENIIIRPDGLVKVVDFGLAKLIEPTTSSFQRDSRDTQISAPLSRTVQTLPGLLLGTATYMSPEQARGLETDARTDIWSWGVVFYEMLAGEPPFTGTTNSDIIAEILKSEPQFHRSSFERLPDSAVRIMRGALTKKLDSRYTSMSEIDRALRELRQQVETTELAKAQFRETRTTGPHQAPPFSATTASVTNTSLSAEAASRRISKQIGWATQRKFLLSAIVILVFAAAVALVIRQRSASRKAAATGAVEIVHLTNDGRVQDAAISPDGRLLAYVRVASGKQSLRAHDLQSGDDWEVLPPDLIVCWGLRFALNNQSLFYVSKQAGGTVSVLYRVPLHGGPSQKLVANIDSPPGVSPDGMEIAFVRSYPVEHRDALIVAHVDGSGEREVLVRKHPDRFVSAGVSWSPDGKMIAAGATRRDETEAAVIGVPLDGRPMIEITGWDWQEIAGVVWKNDARTLIFSGQKPGKDALQLWKVTYPEHEAAPITNDENEYEEATIGPGVAVVTQRYEVAELWESANPPNRLTSGTHNGTDGLTITSTGRIIYSVGESLNTQLWSMNLDGSNASQLVPTTGVNPTSSKDGKLVAYTSFDGGRHVWLVGDDGTNNHQLTFGDGETYACITPDGHSVLYVSRAKERGTLWKIPTTGGPAIQLTFAGNILRPVVSPDGKMVACTFRSDEGDRWKLAIFSIDGGEPLKTFAVPSAFYQRIHWAPDSSAFTYLDQVNGTQNIWRQPLNGSTPVMLTDFDEDKIWAYDWTADGRKLIVSRGGRRRDVVMIKRQGEI